MSSGRSRSLVVEVDPAWPGSSLSCFDRGVLATRLTRIVMICHVGYPSSSLSSSEQRAYER